MRRIALILVLAFAAARPARGMDARVCDVHAGSDTVVAAVEVRSVVPDSLKQALDSGVALHLRLQAELWESRPVWDRLVFPALVRVFRIARGGTPARLVIVDSSGAEQPLPTPPAPFATTLTLGHTDRVTASGRYYVHLSATVGTIADREIDTVNDAVFGHESDSGSAAAFGRFVLRSMLQLSDYLQSVTVEARGRKISGAEILKK